MKQGLGDLVKTADFEQKTAEEKESVLVRARVFYFNRFAIIFTVPSTRLLTRLRHRITSSNITVEDVQSTAVPSVADASASSSEEQATPSEGVSEPHILSFAELKELIEQGKTDQIPNNRTIPETLNVCTSMTVVDDTDTDAARYVAWTA